LGKHRVVQQGDHPALFWWLAIPGPHGLDLGPGFGSIRRPKPQWDVQLQKSVSQFQFVEVQEFGGLAQVDPALLIGPHRFLTNPGYWGIILDVRSDLAG